VIVRKAFMGRVFKVLLALPLSMIVSAALADEDELALGPNDFAVGRPLITEGEGPLHSVLLDFDVYRASVGPRLDDLRVFDGQGEPIPYAIRRRLPKERSGPPSQLLPIFRLDSIPGLSVSIGGRYDGDDYRIDAELSSTGAVLSIRRGSDANAAPKVGPAGWLLDTSGLDRAVVRLDLTLADGGNDFVSRLRLESSDDLARWRRVDTQIALARLEQDGHRIERTSFPIPRTKTRYLRLTPTGESAPVELTAVRAFLAPDQPARPRLDARIEGRPDPDDPSIVLFDLEATPPIETVRVRIDQMNSIVEGRLESASQAEGPWRLRQAGLFYLFDRSGELRNPPASWKAPRDRYLRLVSSSRGGGLRGAIPTLEIEWRSEQLLFLERDGGESILAIGRAGAQDGSFDATDLLRMSGRSTDDPVPATALLGSEFELAGDSVLEPTKPIPWRTYALSALLIVIVGIVLALSLRLMRAESD